MAQTTAIGRQPTKLDYASPTQFRFVINQLPKVEFNTISANIPGINLGEAMFPTPYKEIPLMGDTLTYDNLELNFIVDEYLENWMSVHDWLTAIGFPKDREQFSQFRGQDSATPIPTAGNTKTDIGTTTAATAARSMFSDMTLSVLSNKNNAILECRFYDAFPVSLSGINYTQIATDIENIVATVNFRYKLYEMVKVES